MRCFAPILFFTLLLTFSCKTQKISQESDLRGTLTIDASICTCQNMKLEASEIISIKNMAYLEASPYTDEPGEECVMVAKVILARMCAPKFFGSRFHPGQLLCPASRTDCFPTEYFAEVNAKTYINDNINIPSRLTAYAVMANTQFHPQRVFKIGSKNPPPYYVSQPNNVLMNSQTYLQDYYRNLAPRIYFDDKSLIRFNTCADSIERYLVSREKMEDPRNPDDPLNLDNPQTAPFFFGTNKNDVNYYATGGDKSITTYVNDTFIVNNQGNYFGGFVQLPFSKTCNLKTGAEPQ